MIHIVHPSRPLMPCILLVGAATLLLGAPPPAKELPGVHVDVAGRTVEIEAEVCLREGDWLELLACGRHSREHESILVTDALASHVHLALLMIGLEPGAPMRWRTEGERQVVMPPRGPGVKVSLIYEREGKAVEVAPSQWITNSQAKQPLADDIWLFSGSSFVEFQGERRYRGDLGGTLISLVNFGDDVLTRPTSVTNYDDEGMWGTNTEHIPAIGTRVRIRLQPAPAEEASAPPTYQPAQGRMP